MNPLKSHKQNLTVLLLGSQFRLRFSFSQLSLVVLERNVLNWSKGHSNKIGMRHKMCYLWYVRLAAGWSPRSLLVETTGESWEALLLLSNMASSNYSRTDSTMSVWLISWFSNVHVVVRRWSRFQAPQAPVQKMPATAHVSCLLYSQCLQTHYGSSTVMTSPAMYSEKITVDLVLLPCLLCNIKNGL